MFGTFDEDYYSNGILKFEGICKDKKPNGYGKSYFEDGKLKYEGMWANGVYHGEGRLYDEIGNLLYDGEWMDGHQIDRKFERTYDEYNSDKLDKLILEMNSYIGLMNVKKELNSLINFVKLQQLRKRNGLKTPNISLHMMYVGNPGTGKTTIARIMSKILYELGYLSKGHIIETNRAGLVAGYLGQTAIKTEETIKKAIGGVLFIDEAYALASDDDYGQEAINTLLKMMEDYRDNLVVIVAGYPTLMKKFVESNPGLASRFNRHVIFDDYNLNELMDIFQFMCNECSYKMDDEAREYLSTYISGLLNAKDKNFGNARTIRNIFEKSITFHANRLMGMKRYNEEELSMIVKADILRSTTYQEDIYYEI